MLKEAQNIQDENQMEKGRVAPLNWLLNTREKDIIEKSKIISENVKESAFETKKTRGRRKDRKLQDKNKKNEKKTYQN